MPVRLAFSTNAFKKFSLEDAVKSIAQTGYEGVELLCDVPHAYPPLFLGDDVKIMSVKRLLSRLAIKISNLNAFTLYGRGDTYHPSWIESSEQARNERLQHTLNCITLAKEIGAKNLSTEPGGPITGGSVVNRSTLERIFVEGIKVAEKAAEKEGGIKILVEPEPGLLIENSSQFLHFIKEFQSGCVGLNFDIGHFYCGREDPEELIYKLADYIGHFHLEDIAANRIHHHLVPGQGAIDFKKVFGAINGIGYDGFVTVELYPYQDSPVLAAKNALEHLKNSVIAA